jgi:signal transduction histidine kinase
MARRQSADMMSMISDFRSWPVSWKAPLLAAGLLVAISATISQFVLSRLAADQEANLQSLTDAYLDGVSAAVVQPVVRGDVWETFDALDRARVHYAGVAARYVIVETADRRVLAASEPRRFPIRTRVLSTVERQFPTHDGMALNADKGKAWLSRTLKIEGHPIGRVLAEIDIAALLKVRRHVFWTLLTVNGVITLAFSAIAYFALKRMLRPLGTLTSYVERVREGRAEPIPEDDRYKLSAEFRRLFDRFNAMARALNEREELAAHLATREKLAVLGKLASGMAHEVNNPLGGMFNALDTLQRHGANPEVRESTVNLLRRGFGHIRNVVRSTLVIYRSEGSLLGLAPSDLDDLRVLVEPEVARKAVHLEWRNNLDVSTPVAAGSVRQATLNLLLNACAATRSGGKISFASRIEGDSVVVVVADTGPGLAPALADYLTQGADAGVVPADGLGLWIVRRLVVDQGGVIAVSCGPIGTSIRVAWPFRTERLGGYAPAARKELAHVE